MKINNKEIERRMQHFESVCRGEGIKLTHQRMEIFREVAQTGDHPDADQIFQRVRSRIPTVSLDTVYRTLWLLKDLGLVVPLHSSRERTRFDANLENHHHFICSQCVVDHRVHLRLQLYGQLFYRHFNTESLNVKITTMICVSAKQLQHPTYLRISYKSIYSWVISRLVIGNYFPVQIFVPELLRLGINIFFKISYSSFSLSSVRSVLKCKSL